MYRYPSTIPGEHYAPHDPNHGGTGTVRASGPLFQRPTVKRVMYGEALLSPTVKRVGVGRLSAQSTLLTHREACMRRVLSSHPVRHSREVYTPRTHPGRHSREVYTPYTHPGRHSRVYTPYTHPERHGGHIHPVHTQGGMVGIYTTVYTPKEASMGIYTTVYTHTQGG